MLMLETPLSQIKPPAKAMGTAVEGRKSPTDRAEADGADFDTEYVATGDQKIDQDATASQMTDKNPSDPEAEGDVLDSSKTEVLVDTVTDGEVDTDATPVLPAARQEPAARLAPEAVGPSAPRPDASKVSETRVDMTDIGQRSQPSPNAPTETPASAAPPVAGKPAANAPGIAIASAAIDAAPAAEQARRPQIGTTAENVVTAQSARPLETPVAERLPAPAAFTGNTPVATLADAPKPAIPSANSSIRNERAILHSVTETPVNPPQPQNTTAAQTAAMLQVIQNTQHKQFQLVSNKQDRLEALAPFQTELDGPSALEPRAQQSASANATTAVLARAETPGLVARQLAEALQNRPGQQVELSLNPRELGRVRMNISAAEAGITVTVLAERPETLDLMRRNIDELAREFQNIGYQNINFAFAEGHTQDRQQEASPKDPFLETTTHLDLDDPAQSEANTPLTIAGSGVDLRL